MREYDVVVVGGAVAGPVAAKFSAAQGLSTLLVEKDEVPREKSCSGIQFPYLERIIGDRIPSQRLCNNRLSKVEIHLPDGKTTTLPFPMVNFMRKPFDEWLCALAQSYGAEFRDRTAFRGLEEGEDGITVRLKGPSVPGEESVRCRWLVDATGMRPAIRRSLRRGDGFKEGSSGASLNYYFTAEGDLEPDRLYQFWDIELNNMMFAWIYNKTLDDGKDYWVLGTGYDRDVVPRADLFMERATRLFNLRNITIVKKEGYSSSMAFEDGERIWLGEGNILMAGDAAGLIDLTRGVGMDAAALSGRLAAKAIGIAARTGRPVGPVYTRLMARLVRQTKANQAKGMLAFRTNEELSSWMARSMAPMGLHLVGNLALNALRRPERFVMLP